MAITHGHDLLTVLRVSLQNLLGLHKGSLNGQRLKVWQKILIKNQLAHYGHEVAT